MNILISNDDGYLAPGIQELARRIRRFGNVTVVAPEQNHSGASNSLTLNPSSFRTPGPGKRFLCERYPIRLRAHRFNRFAATKTRYRFKRHQLRTKYGRRCALFRYCCSRHGGFLIRLPILCFFSSAFGLVLFGFRRGSR